MGKARERDACGRRLPDWKGCQIIVAGEVFLMNPQSAQSLDGRYLGPMAIPRASGVRFRGGQMIRFVFHRIAGRPLDRWKHVAPGFRSNQSPKWAPDRSGSG
jgi:hypothetical protein